MKNKRFLGRYRHTLAIDRIETADRVAQGEQAGRQVRQSLEMAPHALWKAELWQPFGRCGVLDSLVHGRRSQLPRIAKKAVPLGGGRSAVSSAETYDPSVTLYWQH